jgi:hypothetical protein
MTLSIRSKMQKVLLKLQVNNIAQDEIFIL